jgi:hypothetical protein
LSLNASSIASVRSPVVASIMKVAQRRASSHSSTA